MSSKSWWADSSPEQVEADMQQALACIEDKLDQLAFSPDLGSSQVIVVDGQIHVISLYQDEIQHDVDAYLNQQQLRVFQSESNCGRPRMVRAECAILRPGAIPPIRKRPTDAGYDIISHVDIELPPRGNVDVATGYAISVQRGYYFTVEGRSGLGVKFRIVPFTGTIDACYVGELWVMLTNNSDETFSIRRGDRIAQLIVKEQIDLDIVLVTEFSDEYKSRGTAGFGSSGR